MDRGRGAGGGTSACAFHARAGSLADGRTGVRVCGGTGGQAARSRGGRANARRPERERVRPGISGAGVD